MSDAIVHPAPWHPTEAKVRTRQPSKRIEGIDMTAEQRGELEVMARSSVLPWTTRLMAARPGLGKDTVARIWRDDELPKDSYRSVAGSIPAGPTAPESLRRRYSSTSVLLW